MPSVKDRLGYDPMGRKPQGFAPIAHAVEMEALARAEGTAGVWIAGRVLRDRHSLETDVLVNVTALHRETGLARDTISTALQAVFRKPVKQTRAGCWYSVTDFLAACKVRSECPPRAEKLGTCDAPTAAEKSCTAAEKSCTPAEKSCTSSAEDPETAGVYKSRSRKASREASRDGSGPGPVPVQEKGGGIRPNAPGRDQARPAAAPGAGVEDGPDPAPPAQRPSPPHRDSGQGRAQLHALQLTQGEWNRARGLMCCEAGVVRGCPVPDAELSSLTQNEWSQVAARLSQLADDRAQAGE